MFTLILVSLLLLPHCFGDTLSKLETTFLLRYSTNETQCPTTIQHTEIRLYSNLLPNETVPGLLWRNLRINGASCQSSPLPNSATYFQTPAPSPPDTPSGIANPWIAIGIDNAPRLCDTFRAVWPGRYFFTDDMPRFRQRFINEGLIPIQGVAEDAKRGDVWLISRESSSNGVSSNTICVFEEIVQDTTGSPPLDSPREQDTSEPACFVTASKVPTPTGWKNVEDLRRGDIVRGLDGWDQVISLSHSDRNALAHFVKLAGHNFTLVLTHGHYVYAEGGLQRAGDVKVGDWVRTHSGWGRVESVGQERGKGLFSPITKRGSIVVSGVVCSVYTDVMAVQTAHALLVPVRAGWGEWRPVIEALRRLFVTLFLTHTPH